MTANSRVSRSDTWVLVVSDAQRVHHVATSYIYATRMRIRADVDGAIEAQQGSQFLTRLIGGWFIGRRWLPKRAVIRVLRDPGGIRIEATIEEKLGFGLLDPKFRRRYEGYFAAWLAGLRNATTQGTAQ